MPWITADTPENAWLRTGGEAVKDDLNPAEIMATTSGPDEPDRSGQPGPHGVQIGIGHEHNVCGGEEIALLIDVVGDVEILPELTASLPKEEAQVTMSSGPWLVL